MTSRAPVALALLVGPLFAPSAAAAQDRQDPEPEVSDEGDVWDRVLAGQVTAGLDTPFGVAGGAIEISPIRYFVFYVGGGVSRSGGRVAGGVRGQAPVGNAAIGLSLGLGGGSQDWESRTGEDEAFRTSRHWDLALFFHGGLSAEYRWDSGLFGRIAFGIDALLTPEADTCSRGEAGAQESCGVSADGLAKPVRGWAGLTVGYALDL